MKSSANNEGLFQEVKSLINALKALDGKRVFPQDLEELLKRFRSANKILKQSEADQKLYADFQKAYSAMMKLWKAVKEYGSVKVEIGFQGLSGCDSLLNAECYGIYLFGRPKVEQRIEPHGLGTTLFDHGAAQSDMFSQRPKTKQPEQPAWYAELLRNGFTIAEIEYFGKDYGKDGLEDEIRQLQNYLSKDISSTSGELNHIVSVFQKHRVWQIKNGQGDNVNAKRLSEIFRNLVAKALKSKSGQIDFAKLPKNQVTEIRELLNQFAPKPPKAEPKPRGRKPKAQPAPNPNQPAQPGNGDPIAVWLDMSKIFTDTKRFQNRNAEFSEATARSIEQNYDERKFDPIVVWKDTKDKKTYILSGHSRFEGMRRRGEKKIKARYYNGTEAEAIQYANIDANRTASAESLIEDLKAYRLGRDGDSKRGVPPKKPADLKQSFKGKWAKLDDWTYLDPVGSFVRMLASESISEFPYAERISRWVGQLRKQYPEITNDMERNIWNWTYDDKAKGYRLDEPTFKGTIEERLSSGRELLFDCYDDHCEGETKPLEKFLKTSEERALQKAVTEIDKNLKRIRERLKAKAGSADAIYTDDERNHFIRWGKELEEKRARIIKDTKQAIKDQKALFGTKKRKN